MNNRDAVIPLTPFPVTKAKLVVMDLLRSFDHRRTRLYSAPLPVCRSLHIVRNHMSFQGIIPAEGPVTDLAFEIWRGVLLLVGAHV